MTQMIQNILKLSVSERILMVEAIWDSIALNDKKVTLSENTKNILSERLQGHSNNPDAGSKWSDVMSRVKKQF